MSFYYYGGGADRNGCLSSAPKVTRNLIIINIIVYIATLLNKGFMYETFALFYPSSPYYHWWQLVSHMFMHGGFLHILFNMYTLYLFGGVVERIIGEKKFLFFYFLCGLGSVALHFGAMNIEMQSYMEAAALGNTAAINQIAALRMTPTVGASGAIYGLLIAYAMLFPESKMTLLFPPVTLSAKWMVAIFVAIELLTGIGGANSGIAHFAHLGGMLIGFIMILIWRKRGTLFDKNKLL